ncbi:metal ABC transporter ATP-binding protein [Treponema sp.]|uniref:metal ABC transporter ATP-binding protein n=1 Tax=Treponema sp. TaxID=166 RepID=UPI00298D60CD|nr:metal ABC transporter ATP-binding protein [Treponema sp.]MCI7396776.1 metal ABC transporter ATP-binding protein [Spirochaetia bacterium]
MKDINLHIHCGELTAIVGRNGAGKSTFMKALLNTIPHTGTVIYEGERCAGHCGKDRTSDHDRYCTCHKKIPYTTTKPVFGYVPQSLSVEQGTPTSVEDLVLSCISRRPAWLPHRKKDKEKVAEILKSTNAHELASRRVCDLSGGELQRVMLALAIHPVPDILLLDEPVSGVDRTGLKSFYQLVSSIRRDYDITVLLISHDLDLVARHADRVVFINNSSAIIGRVDEVYANKDFIDVFGNVEIASDRNEGGDE